jgi:hypothetical protein
MSFRVASAFVVVSGLCLGAWAAVPTGRRSVRLRATHVVVGETTLAMKATRAALQPGVGVVVAGGGRATGPMKVTLVGNVGLTGMVDGRELGLRAARDAELLLADGTPLGQLRAGALVRPLAQPALGLVLVEVLGEVFVKARVARDALTAEPRELVLVGEWTHRTVRELDVFAGADLQGAPRVRVAQGARLVALSTDGQSARIKTYGTVEAEGYVSMAELLSRADDKKAGAAPPLKRPTHEAFVDLTLYGSSDEKNPLGTLRGGTLLELARQLSLNEFVQVTTLGDVTVTGYVKRQKLRPMEESVWRER